MIYTRQGCHLCDEATRLATAVCDERGVGLRLIDVDTDPDLRRAYSDHVPVTVVDGRLLSRWFLDPQRLVEALTAPTEPQRS